MPARRSRYWSGPFKLIERIDENYCGLIDKPEQRSHLFVELPGIVLPPVRPSDDSMGRQILDGGNEQRSEIRRSSARPDETIDNWPVSVDLLAIGDGLRHERGLIPGFKRADSVL